MPVAVAEIRSPNSFATRLIALDTKSGTEKAAWDVFRAE
jgi:hypothetical protein